MITSQKISARFAAVSAVALLAIGLIGCSAPGRPSVDDLQKGITEIATAAGAEAIFTEQYTECVATALLDSDLSDATLAKIASGNDVSLEAMNSDKSTAAAMYEATSSCATSLQ